MENEFTENPIISSDNSTEESEQLLVNEEAKACLLSTAKWVKFLAVMGAIFCSFSFLLGLAIMGSGTFSSAMGRAYGLGEAGALAGIIYIVISVLCLFPIIKMFGFVKKVRTAIISNSDHLLFAAFNEMRSVWKFYGILAIIYLVIIGISIVGGIIGVLIAAAH